MEMKSKFVTVSISANGCYSSSVFPGNLLSGSVILVAAQFPVLQEHSRPALASSINQLLNWRSELHAIQFPVPASW